jgi:hypothetical protein
MILSLVALCGLVAALVLFHEKILAVYQDLKCLPTMLEEKFEQEKQSPQTRESSEQSIKVDKKTGYARRKREPLMISLYFLFNCINILLVELKFILTHVMIMDSR